MWLLNGERTIMYFDCFLYVSRISSVVFVCVAFRRFLFHINLLNFNFFFLYCLFAGIFALCHYFKIAILRSRMLRNICRLHANRPFQNMYATHACCVGEFLLLFVKFVVLHNKQTHIKLSVLFRLICCHFVLVCWRVTMLFFGTFDKKKVL